MADINPRSALAQFAAQIPAACRDHVVVVGSLAAAYHLLGRNNIAIRTKDVDCVIAPRLTAAARSVELVEQLLASGWKPRRQDQFSAPGNASTPESALPLVRLYPPGGDWWLELLTVPESDGAPQQEWTRVPTSQGHFGLRAFQFMSLSTFQAAQTPLGIRCARPEMMALANMLEHPVIRPDVMSSQIVGRSIKRSNKDLGRVLGLAHLSADTVDQWHIAWKEGLAACFPARWQTLARAAGSGIRSLLASPQDLEEAHWTLTKGLLANQPVTERQLAFSGERLVLDAIEPLERTAH